MAVVTRNLMLLGLALVGCAAYAAQPAAPPSKAKPVIKLEGGVSMNVPRTPEDVARYLVKMRAIIKQYEQLAVGTLISDGAVNMNPDNLDAARAQTIQVIRAINATIPPAELKNEHNQLARTMLDVGNAMQSQTEGGGLTALMQLMPLLGRLHSTLENYHSGVKYCISYYKLDNSLDPFAGENENTKRTLGNAINSMKTQMLTQPFGGGGAMGGSSSDMNFGRGSSGSSLGGGGFGSGFGSTSFGDTSFGSSGADAPSFSMSPPDSDSKSNSTQSAPGGLGGLAGMLGGLGGGGGGGDGGGMAGLGELINSLGAGGLDLGALMGGGGAAPGGSSGFGGGSGKGQTYSTLGGTNSKFGSLGGSSSSFGSLGGATSKFGSLGGSTSSFGNLGESGATGGNFGNLGDLGKLDMNSLMQMMPGEMGSLKNLQNSGVGDETGGMPGVDPSMFGNLLQQLQGQSK